MAKSGTWENPIRNGYDPRNRPPLGPEAAENQRRVDEEDRKTRNKYPDGDEPLVPRHNDPNLY